MTPIDRVIKKTTQGLATEDGQMILSKYKTLSSSQEWSVYQGFLVQIGNTMLKEMLSPEFTKLSAEEKDIHQKVMYNTKKIIDFLINPANVKTLEKYAAHNKKMEAAMKSNRRGRPKGATKKNK